MIYLLLAITSSALVSIFMRWSTGKLRGKVCMLAVNYLTCMLLGAYTAGFDSLFPPVPGLPGAVAMGAVNGGLYLAGFLLLQRSMERNGVVLSSIFMKLGLLVPMVISVAVFRQLPSAVQVIGFVLALGAIVLINFEKGGTAPGARGLLLILLLAGGSADAMSEVFEELGDAALSGQFLFYTFLAAFVLCLLLMLWKQQRPGLGDVFFGVIIGVPNFFSARFLLQALQRVTPVIVYPTYCAATLLVVTLAGVFLFREKLNRRQTVAVGVILLALVLLNL